MSKTDLRQFEKRLQDKTEILKQEITSNPLHCLGVKSRNAVFSSLSNDRQRAFLLLHTLKNITHLWDNSKNTDTVVNRILSECLLFLNQKSDAASLIKLADDYFVYMQNRLEDKPLSAIYTGFSFVYAAYEIARNSYLQDETEEYSEDPFEWSSLEYASLAYNNGCNDLSLLDKEKNFRFWNNFFLNELSPFVSSNSNNRNCPERQQEKIALQNPQILNRLDELSQAYKAKYIRSNVDTVEVCFYAISNMVSVTGNILYQNGCNQKISNTDIYIFSSQFKFDEIIFSVKQAMYLLKPDEGAWLSMTLILYNNRENTYLFNYDSEDSFFNHIDKKRFVEELKKYPRDTIPNWLNKITN